MSDRAAGWLVLAILALAFAVLARPTIQPVAAPEDPCARAGRYQLSGGNVPLVILDTCNGNAWQLTAAASSGAWWRAMVFGVAEADRKRSFTDFGPGVIPGLEVPVASPEPPPIVGPASTSSDP